jgi:hypothetical protein
MENDPRNYLQPGCRGGNGRLSTHPGLQVQWAEPLVVTVDEGQRCAPVVGTDIGSEGSSPEFGRRS